MFNINVFEIIFKINRFETKAFKIQIQIQIHVSKCNLDFFLLVLAYLALMVDDLVLPSMTELIFFFFLCHQNFPPNCFNLTCLWIGFTFF